MLPALLGKAVIPILVLGMIAFCGLKLQTSEEQQTVRIGYHAEDSRIMEMAVSFVENMESVKDFCELIPVSEEEGLCRLQEGSLSALLVLPENVVEEILTGSNRPAILYLAGEPSVDGMVFEELAEALVGMLRTAQAEIYAAGELTEMRRTQQKDMQSAVDMQGAVDLQELYEEIDYFNLRLLLNREACFRERTLSPTGREGLSVYRGSVFGTVFLLVMSLFFLKYLGRSEVEQLWLTRRVGIPTGVQLAGRTVVAFTFALPVLLVLFAAGAVFGGSLSAETYCGAGCVLLGELLLILWLQMLLAWTKSRKTAVVSAGLIELVWAYLAGCIIPPALMPDIAVRAARFFPATLIRTGFVRLLSGTATEMALPGYALTGFLVPLGCWCVCRMAAKRLLHRHPCDLKQKADNRKKEDAGSKRGSICLLLVKRLLTRKVFLAGLLAAVCLSAAAVRAEEHSDTVIRAAVCTGEESLKTLLCSGGGLVDFVLCDTEEKVKRLVMQGDAECGYVLQDGLLTDIAEGRGSWTVTVYRGADFVLTDVVNEVLFERLFYRISSEWYEELLVGLPYFAQGAEPWGEEQIRRAAGDALARKMTDQSTFAFETRYLSAGGWENEPLQSGTDEKGTTVPAYPVRAVAAGCLGFCVLFGVIQVWEDQRKHRFPAKNRRYTAAMTVLLPTAAGALAALAILLAA